ncbi:MAG: LacI family transcriptional regulator [Treponema sp.]|jgi:LacI family transcriptional regulator|nr:LacI family transcriptional regulator [Treponema sp.]
MSITTKEIAKICNVSRGTVDRALNGRSGINSETRERVLEIVRKYNYQPHLIASSLSRGKSMSIGVVLFDLNNRYFSQLSNTISLAARERGYFTYISVSEKDHDSEMQILRNLASRRVDGILLLPAIQGKDYIDFLKSLEIPIVTTGNHLPGIHHVSINDFNAAFESADYISRRGYRRICFICPPLRKKGALEGRLNITSQDLRARGVRRFIDTNRGYQLEMLLQKDYVDRAVAMVRQGGEKIAFFCSSDVYALELLKRFREEGIAVPRDAGLMGFDNLDILAYINPRITTVSTSVEIQGRKAMDVLFKLISGETAPKLCYVPHEICPGETL